MIHSAYARRALKLAVALIISLSLGIISALPPVAVSAENGAYARIITEDTPFYSDVNGEILLFYLPYTYYVRVIDDGEKFSHVECYGTGDAAALDGYVPSEMLYYDGLSVKSPYAQIKITAADTAILYADAKTTTALQYIFGGRVMNFYGKFPVSENENLYYVSYNDRLGYISEKDIIPFTLPNHPNELTFITPEPEPEPDNNTGTGKENKGESLFDLRILIIACLVFAGVTALFIAFKKRPVKNAAAGYYDENDFE